RCSTNTGRSRRMQSAPHPMSSRRSGSDRVRSVGSGAEDWSIVIQVKLLRKYLLWHLPISRHGQRSSRSLLPPAPSYELRSWLHCSAAAPPPWKESPTRSGQQVSRDEAAEQSD